MPTTFSVLTFFKSQVSQEILGELPSVGRAPFPFEFRGHIISDAARSAVNHLIHIIYNIYTHTQLYRLYRYTFKYFLWWTCIKNTRRSILKLFGMSWKPRSWHIVAPRDYDRSIKSPPPPPRPHAQPKYAGFVQVVSASSNKGAPTFLVDSSKALQKGCKNTQQGHLSQMEFWKVFLRGFHALSETGRIMKNPYIWSI